MELKEPIPRVLCVIEIQMVWKEMIREHMRQDSYRINMVRGIPIQAQLAIYATPMRMLIRAASKGKNSVVIVIIKKME